VHSTNAAYYLPPTPAHSHVGPSLLSNHHSEHNLTLVTTLARCASNYRHNNCTPFNAPHSTQHSAIPQPAISLQHHGDHHPQLPPSGVLSQNNRERAGQQQEQTNQQHQQTRP
jgi:hypothetical protein